MVGELVWKRDSKICAKAVLHSQHPVVPGGVSKLLMEIKIGMRPRVPAMHEFYDMNFYDI